jgi:UDP-GlcNAc:undecaprenyl-phosphate GlcNAc-1-phosphate transferase
MTYSVSCSDRFIHHRLLDAGLSQRAWGASLVPGLVALALTFASGRSAALILLALGLVEAAILRRLGFIQIERAGEVLEIRRKNLGRCAALHGVAEQLRHATSGVEVFDDVSIQPPRCVPRSCDTLPHDPSPVVSHSTLARASVVRG